MFDGLPQKYEAATPALKIIDTMIGRLGDPRRWCQGVSRYGAGHCIGGWLFQVSGEPRNWTRAPECLRPDAAAVWRAIEGASPGRNIVGFNDDRATTHADVMRVLHRAREILSSQSR